MEKRDFFISYTNADGAWAKWIAWQLEKVGYKCHIQDWDFIPGSNWVEKMNQGTLARRTLLVYSPDYLKNARYVTPEWQAAFAQDPNGEKGKILGVKVKNCHLEGLLHQLVWVSLVGLEEQEAKAVLLNAAKGERAKPRVAPPFPGVTQPLSRQAPYFPGIPSVGVNSSVINQSSPLEIDPALTLAANQRVEKAFKQRPPQLASHVWMQLVWTPMQSEEMLDPNQFVDEAFKKRVIYLTRKGKYHLFNDVSAISTESNASHLLLIQKREKRFGTDQIRIYLYSDGTISILFTDLHQPREDYAFSNFIIDEDLVKVKLQEAVEFIMRWYNDRDPALKYNPLVYNLCFHNLEYHRFGKTPSGQSRTFEPFTRNRPNPLIIYNTPRKLARDDLQNTKNLISHMLTRTKLVFDNKESNV